MRTVSLFVLAAALVVSAGYAPSPAGQQPGKKAEGKPAEIFRQFRALMSEGRYDVAAVVLQQFLDANPSDQDLLDLEARYGTTVFLNLRTVPKWSDDAALDKKARETIETLITRSRAAGDKVLRTPERMAKFINNLGQSPEERLFAENELRKSGDYAIPFMVKAFKDDTDRNISNGIARAIPNLEQSAMAGWLAATDGLPLAQQYLVFAGVTSRPDAVNLQTSAQTDFVPYMWRIMAQTEGQRPEPPTRTFAKSVLTTLGHNPDKTDPRAALVGIARTFYDRKAKFVGTKTNPDGSPSTVPVWVWDPMAQPHNLVKLEDVPVGQAEEYYGLRYARWALEKDPTYQPAQQLILALSAERAVERGKFGELSKTDPAAYQLLASAPADVLHDLLDAALAQNRPALVLALTQALGDRADKGAAGPRPGPNGVRPARESLLARALDFPDPRVRLAAANALLRSPTPVDAALRGKIVEVLRTAAGADPGVPANAKGQVLIADPNKQRAESSAMLLTAMGYDVEVVTSGRDLFRRVARASDFDMILIDHHIVNPELPDVLAHLRADLNAGRRPILVIASADKPRPPSFQMLLLRLALLIAATESDPVTMPPPFNPDPSAPYNMQTREVLPGMPPEMLAAARKTSAGRRDAVFATTTTARVARLLRVVETSGVVPTPRQQALLELRAEQLTLAVLGAEYPMSSDSAPRTFERFRAVQNQIAAQPPVDPYEGVGLEELMARIERLEVDVARVPEIQKKYDALRLRIDPEALGLFVRSTRDPVIEAKVSRVLRGFPGVKMIPEPYSRVGFEDDVRTAFSDDPAAAPRDPAEKAAAAKLAIEWLRKMAVGEVPGFNITTDRATEKVLRDSLRIDDRAEPAIAAVTRFPSAEAQQDLLTLALNQARPLPLRLQAADACIRHIQVNGKLTPQTTVMELGNRAAMEPNAELRGKLLVIKNLLSPSSTDFVPNLLNYRPSLKPVPKDMPPDPKKIDPKGEPKADPKAKDPGMGNPPKQ